MRGINPDDRYASMRALPGGEDSDLIWLSLITLFAGPLLYQWMRKGGLVARTFDRVIMIFLILLVAFMLVPEAFSGLGWFALVLMLAGYLGPGLLESGLQKLARTLHLASLALAFVGLTLHAMLDGAGLAGSELHASEHLALAIVVHRFGVGLVLWLVLKPVFGRPAAFGALLLIAAATLLGYAMSEKLLPLAGQNSVLIIQALIIGTIIHSLVHREHVEPGQ